MTPLTEEDRLRLAVYLGITHSAAEMLVRMFNSPILSYEEIVRDKLCTAHRRVICTLRRSTEAHGIEINTHHGTGYWIDNAGRNAILSLLRTNAAPEAS
jgi:hypothetical protein